MSELRFTDDSPPRHVLENVPNWVHAHGEEGRRGQDETTIRAQRRQNRIDDETQYTTADVWLNDGRIVLGMLSLSRGRVTALEVYETDAPWRIRHDPRQMHWVVDAHRNARGASLGDSGRFPLKYCSRLPYAKRRPLKGIINGDGSQAEWILEE